MYFLLLQVIQSDFKFLATELRIFLNETFWSFSSDDFKLDAEFVGCAAWGSIVS